MATTTTTTTTTKTKKTTTHNGAKNVKGGAGKARGGKGKAKAKNVEKDDGEDKGYFLIRPGGSSNMRNWGLLNYVPGVLPGSTPTKGNKCMATAVPKAPLQFTSGSAIFPAKRFF